MFFLLLLLLVPVSLTQDPCASYPNPYTSWMGDLYNKTVLNNTWGSRRLNEILVGGSHDAGLWEIEDTTGFAFLLPVSYFVTQSRDLIGQLCYGARWFDIRLSFFNNQWHIFHGTPPLVAYGVDVYTLMDQLTQFLNFPKYSREVVFWRIKVGDGNSEDLATILRSELAEFMVDNRGNRSLQGLTLNEIWSQRSVGNLVIMEYSWYSPPVVPGQNQGWFWNYKESQWGEYSDAVDLTNMLTRCTYGQFPRLLLYKAEANSTGPEHPLIGIWWTYTTGDIRDNTDKQWSTYPHALTDFYTLNNGEIGNCLLVDFFGDQSDVMRVIWDYNNNKYGTSPPLPPDFGYSVQSTLPGSGMISGDLSCSNVGSATSAFTTIVIVVFCCVLFVVLVLCIGACVGIVIYCRKGKEVENVNDVYVEFKG